MLCFKFVTKDYESPGHYGSLIYKFNEPVEVDYYAPASEGQRVAGIHVMPVSENVDFDNCIFSDKCIYGEVNEEDIVWLDEKKKMRVKKFLPLGEVTRNTKEIWDILLKNPHFAYRYAFNIDKTPRDDTRNAACSDSYHAYYYAFNVDKIPRDDTRNVACGNPRYAYRYAFNLDKTPRDDTRNAVCGSPEFAYCYAREIDKAPREDTRNAACGNPYYAYYYARHIDKAPREDTRSAVCGNPEFAYRYALNVDKALREDTRNAVLSDQYYLDLYDCWAGKVE